MADDNGMSEMIWNRCDECGRFIAFKDFDNGAVRRLIYPDSELTCETWETLCKNHGASELEKDQER